MSVSERLFWESDRLCCSLIDFGSSMMLCSKLARLCWEDVPIVVPPPLPGSTVVLLNRSLRWVVMLCMEVSKFS